MAEHKHAAVLRAIADGKAVQWKSCDFGGDWQDFYSAGMITPLTHWRHEWRIKPEPKPDVVRYWCVNEKVGESSLHKVNDWKDAYGATHIVKLTFEGETGKCRAEVLP